MATATLNRPPPRSWRDRPIIEPSKVETTDARWVAVRTAVGCEQRVADELRILGYRAYCPLGAKFVFWSDGKRSRQKLVKQFPVFARYIFVGLMPGQELGKGVVDVRQKLTYFHDGEEKIIAGGKRWLAAERIESVLSDSVGPIPIPARAIETLNTAELARYWDETYSWRDKPPFAPGETIMITGSGPFQHFYATVDAQQSEDKIKVLVSIFGRPTAVTLDMADIEAV